MSRFIRAVVCAAALSSACAAPAFAAEPAKPAAASASAALACAKRYNKAMRLEETMEAMMRSMMPILMKQYGANGKTEKEQLILDAIVESTTDLTPKMLDALAPVMVTTFSEAEICGLADFYESPTGQGVVAKMPAYTRASGDVMNEFVPLLQQDMARRVCQKINCGAATDPKKAAAKPS